MITGENLARTDTQGSGQVDVCEYRRYLAYDLDSGELWWRERGDPAFDAHYAGRPALSSVDSSNGYKRGRLLGRALYAHRVIFALAMGRLPHGGIDHINGDKTDNRIINLRECTKAQNARNARGWGRSGLKGVGARRGKWRAYIQVDGRVIHLGTFEQQEAAARAYDAAAVRHFGEFARLNFPASGVRA